MNPGQDLNYHAETHLSDLVVYNCFFCGIYKPPPSNTSSPPCTHAPTHARPSLPVIPDPNPAKAEDAISGLLDTAAV